MNLSKLSLLLLCFISATLMSCSSLEEKITSLLDDESVITLNLGDEFSGVITLGVESATVLELVTELEGASIYYTFDTSATLDQFEEYVSAITVPGEAGDGLVRYLRVFIEYSATDVIDSDDDSSTGDDTDSSDEASDESVGDNEARVSVYPSQHRHHADVTLSLSVDSESQQLYYSLDENDALNEFVAYTDPVTLSGSEDGCVEYHVRAYSLDDNGVTSDIVSKRYKVAYHDLDILEAEVFSGIYTESFSLTFDNIDSGSTVYYTTDGTTPNETSFVYDDSGIAIDGDDVTILAIQVQEGYVTSPVGKYRYKIDPDFESEYDYATLSVSEIQSAIVGDWHGTRYTPWKSPLNMGITFREDGSYSTYSSRDHDVALYYGMDEDHEDKWFSIDELNSDGYGEGDIQVVFSRVFTTNISDLRNVRFSEDLNVVEFEYWHRGKYGPVTFKLYRI